MEDKLLKSIKEAEEKAKQIVIDAQKKADKLVLEGREKAKQVLKSEEERFAASHLSKSKEQSVVIKQKCEKILLDENKKISDTEKKAMPNIKKAAEFVIEKFEEEVDNA